jgi:hypothetical protein
MKAMLFAVSIAFAVPAAAQSMEPGARSPESYS